MTTELPDEIRQQHIPSELYALIIEHMPIPCVDVVVVHQNKALLVNRTNHPAKGEWWLPGGRVLKGELLVQTAKRKAREELGVEVHVGPLVHTEETIFLIGPTGIPVHTVNACFYVSPADSLSSISFDHQHDDFRWIEMPDDSLHPYIKRCLIAAGF